MFAMSACLKIDLSNWDFSNPCQSDSTAVALTLRDFYSGQAIEGGKMLVLARPDFNAFGFYHDTLATIFSDATGAFSHQFRHDTSLFVAYEGSCQPGGNYPNIDNFRLKKGCAWSYDLRLKPFSKLRLTIENPSGRAVMLSGAYLFYPSPKGENIPFFVRSQQFLDGPYLPFDTIAPGGKRIFTLKSLPEETLLLEVRYDEDKRLKRTFQTTRDNLGQLTVKIE